jgi:hypothetical protein
LAEKALLLSWIGVKAERAKFDQASRCGVMQT